MKFENALKAYNNAINVFDIDINNIDLILFSFYLLKLITFFITY